MKNSDDQSNADGNAKAGSEEEWDAKAYFLWQLVSLRITLAKAPDINSQSVNDFLEARADLFAAKLNERIAQSSAQAEMRALKQPNDLLRSAYQIASRRGEKANWEGFAKQLEAELEREHKIMYPDAYLTDPQGISE